VFVGGKFYSCLISHTSGTFATDLAAGDWVLIADLTAIPLVAASQIAVTASGSLTTDVQTSLQALDAGKAPTSHTHPSSAISDSTAAGRAFLTAATVAAQQTLLGLGAQAFVNNPVVTAIPGKLAFTGVISPSSLVADQNDWAPTNWATSSRVRVSSSGAINITGFLATTDGDIKFVTNVGTSNITLVPSSSSSALANRIAGGANIPIRPGEIALLIYDGTAACWRVSGRGAATPTLQNLTSGTSATYTTPTGATWLKVRMIGAGGAGATHASNGAAGGTTSFNSVTAVGGGGGTANTGTSAGQGGTAGTGGTGTATLRVPGTQGNPGGSIIAGASAPTGGVGGAGPFGGAGSAGSDSNAGGNAQANSGAGGGGTGGSSGSVLASCGGGASGEYVELIIYAPAATYTYTVGAGGTNGGAGTGAAGRIIVEEYYN
jgi:hypothetical protein